jgi:hypothetical protein
MFFCHKYQQIANSLIIFFYINGCHRQIKHKKKFCFFIKRDLFFIYSNSNCKNLEVKNLKIEKQPTKKKAF